MPIQDFWRNMEMTKWYIHQIKSRGSSTKLQKLIKILAAKKENNSPQTKILTQEAPKQNHQQTATE